MFKELNFETWLCYEKTTKPLIETNSPIFFGVVDMSYWELYKMTQVVQKGGTPSNPPIIVGYHSDSVTFITEDETSLSEASTSAGLEALNKRIVVYNSKIKNKHGLGKIRASGLDRPCTKNIKEPKVEAYETVEQKMKVLESPEE